MADGGVFTDGMGQGVGLVLSTGILGDLVLPAGAFDPGRADEIRELAAQAAVAQQAFMAGAKSQPVTPAPNQNQSAVQLGRLSNTSTDKCRSSHSVYTRRIGGSLPSTHPPLAVKASGFGHSCGIVGAGGACIGGTL